MHEKWKKERKIIKENDCASNLDRYFTDSFVY